MNRIILHIEIDFFYSARGVVLKGAISHMNHLSRLYKQSLFLLTDFYQLTMAYGYKKMNLDRKEAVFHLHFRRAPFQGGFTIAAGLEYAIDLLENFRVDSSDIAFLAGLKDPAGEPQFDEGFLNHLADLRFTGHLDAVPEGTVVFPYEPILRIQGPLIECQLLESALLNVINFSTLIATKAARTCLAAQGEPVVEFGLRRAQGIDGSLTASRAAYIGGCASTSNVLAGKIFGIPLRGTHSHSWVTVFDDELEAFQAYAKSLPNNCVFLVDTYDTLKGVKNAIEVGIWLKKQGKKMSGIRLDSGDLTGLSVKSRKMLDEAGFPDTKIMATNDLDEKVISELKNRGAQINVWGVGTSLITGKDSPALDGVYKLSAIRDPGQPWKYRMKLSEQTAKISDPGILQVRRYRTESANIADVIYDIHTEPKEGDAAVDLIHPSKEHVIVKGTEAVDLLRPIFRSGKRVYECPDLEQIRADTKLELGYLQNGVKQILNPEVYPVGLETSLFKKKQEIMDCLKNVSSVSKLSDFETI